MEEVINLWIGRTIVGMLAFCVAILLIIFMARTLWQLYLFARYSGGLDDEYKSRSIWWKIAYIFVVIYHVTWDNFRYVFLGKPRIDYLLEYEHGKTILQRYEYD